MLESLGRVVGRVVGTAAGMLVSLVPSVALSVDDVTSRFGTSVVLSALEVGALVEVTDETGVGDDVVGVDVVPDVLDGLVDDAGTGRATTGVVVAPPPESGLGVVGTTTAAELLS